MFTFLPNIQKKYSNLLFVFARFLHENFKLSPNQISIFSFLFSLFSAYLIIRQQIILALAMLFVSLFLDSLDGTVARKYNLASNLGQNLEIIFDRTAEITIFIALSVVGLVDFTLALVAFLAILIMTALSLKTNYDFGAKRIMIFLGPLIGFNAVFYLIILVQLLAIAASLIKIIKKYATHK